MWKYTCNIHENKSTNVTTPKTHDHVTPHLPLGQFSLKTLHSAALVEIAGIFSSLGGEFLSKHSIRQQTTGGGKWCSMGPAILRAREAWRKPCCLHPACLRIADFMLFRRMLRATLLGRFLVVFGKIVRAPIQQTLRQLSQEPQCNRIRRTNGVEGPERNQFLDHPMTQSRGPGGTKSRVTVQCLSFLICESYFNESVRTSSWISGEPT